MSQITLTKGLAPDPPAAGKCALYFKSDGRAYWLDEYGTETPFKAVGVGSGDLLADGTVPLTADWNVGAWKIIAQQLESNIATGTAPFIVASTTLVANLNAALLGDKSLATIESDYAAAIASAVTGLWDDKGAYDADTNSPDLDTSPSGIKQSDAYTVSVAGTFFTEAVEVGDMLVAKQDDPTTLAHWNIFQANLNAAAIVALYDSQVAQVSQVEAEAGTVTDDRRWTPERVKQAIDALSTSGLTWSSVSITTAVTAQTGTVFYNLSATVDADLPTSPSVGDMLMIVNNDDDAGSANNVNVDAGGSNEIHEENVTGIPTLTLGRGESAILVCFDAGTPKKWHLQRIGASDLAPVAALNKAVSGTTYTILEADNGYNLVFTNAAAIAVTLPDTLSTDFHCSIIQTTAAGIPTVTPNTDTINGAGTGVAPAAQWKAMYLNQYAATTWLAIL